MKACSIFRDWRLGCDYEGIIAFSRYTPAFVPAVLAYNPSSGIAIFEYLNDFRPLQRLLERFFLEYSIIDLFMILIIYRIATLLAAESRRMCPASLEQ